MYMWIYIYIYMYHIHIIIHVYHIYSTTLHRNKTPVFNYDLEPRHPCWCYPPSPASWLIDSPLVGWPLVWSLHIWQDFEDAWHFFIGESVVIQRNQINHDGNSKHQQNAQRPRLSWLFFFSSQACSIQRALWWFWFSTDCFTIVQSPHLLDALVGTTQIRSWHRRCANEVDLQHLNPGVRSEDKWPCQSFTSGKLP